MGEWGSTGVMGQLLHRAGSGRLAGASTDYNTVGVEVNVVGLNNILFDQPNTCTIRGECYHELCSTTSISRDVWHLQRPHPSSRKSQDHVINEHLLWQHEFAQNVFHVVFMLVDCVVETLWMQAQQLHGSEQEIQAVCIPGVINALQAHQRNGNVYTYWRVKGKVPVVYRATWNYWVSVVFRW